MNTTNNKKELDVELVRAAKSGDIKAKGKLFERYVPFIRKRYYHVLRAVRGLNVNEPLEFEDFLQEAYLKFEQALQYTDLAKLARPEEWKFLGSFMWYMNNLCTRTEKIARKYKTTHVRLSPEYSSEQEDLIEIENLHTAGPTEPLSFLSPLEICLEKQTVEEFYQSLTPSEKKVLGKRINIKEYGKAPTIASIAQDLHLSKARVQSLHLSLKKKWAQARNS